MTDDVTILFNEIQEGLKYQILLQKWLEIAEAEPVKDLRIQEKLLDINFQININKLELLYKYWRIQLLSGRVH